MQFGEYSLKTQLVDTVFGKLELQIVFSISEERLSIVYFAYNSII